MAFTRIPIMHTRNLSQCYASMTRMPWPSTPNIPRLYLLPNDLSLPAMLLGRARRQAPEYLGGYRLAH